MTNIHRPISRTPFPGLCSLLLFWLLALLLCACGPKNTDQGAGAADAQDGKNPEWIGDPVPYQINIKVEGKAGALAGKMKDLSQLEQLKGEPPDSMLALERRARQDQETAVKLLQSQCYYDGDAKIDINETAKPVVVTLTLIPGPRFTVGKADVVYEPKPEIPPAFQHRTRVTGFLGLEQEDLPAPSFPAQIPGIEIGKPVVASDMLAAVEKIPTELQRRGYPLAKMTNSLYTLNRAEKKLNAEITIDPGLPAYMGNVSFKGAGNVNESYLKRLVPWEPGKEPWDDGLLQDYANSLRATGLFRQVESGPDIRKLGHSGNVAILPVQVELKEGPQRSISASARYDTDTGFGVEGTWEHRNLFHNGEILRLDAPISQEESGLKAHFEKPAFIDRQQRLLLDAHALWENTQAYQQETIGGEFGINRRLARQWYGGISLLTDGGYLKDNEHSEQKPYFVISPRAGIRYDGRNNRMNPSKGTLLELKLQPFSGYYEEEFSAFAGTITLAAWYSPLGRKPDGAIDDTVVLAGRWEAGAMPGATSLRSIPASLRYFTGGAGTVRGYPYQSIGPEDSEGDPLGGRSYQVINLESRFMVAENIGIVPFLDGGMVYREEYPEILGEMDWGLGLGFRYYTPIGPVRLDVATPLQPKDGDPPVQFYISIGQSF